MHLLEMNAIDQHIARVCDPRTARRYTVVYTNPHTGGSWHAFNALPGDVGRAKEALIGQGCRIVIANDEKGEWNSIAWLRHYRPDAPIDALRKQLH
jgi:acetyl-CoA carboxylase beta subunit